jgi:mono/diheme cytochrome c family protein
MERNFALSVRRFARTTAMALLFASPVIAMQVRSRDPEWVPPAKEAAKANPLAGRTDAAGGGRKLFQQRCSKCHGADGRGTRKGPNLAHPDVQAQSDGTLFWKISSGNSHEDMPSFSFLPELQRWQLVLHVREIASGSPSPR